MPASTPSGLDATRRVLHSSADPRVDRTRAAIVDGVRRLVEVDDRASSITVAGIVRASGVSRSSFYAHFKDVDDVASYVLKDAFGRIRALYVAARNETDVSPYEAMRLAQVQLVDLFDENRALIGVASSHSFNGAVRAEAMQAMADELRVTFDAVRIAPPDVRADLAAVYIAGAAIGLLESWLRNDVQASAREIVEHLMGLMPIWLAEGERSPSTH